MKARLVWAFLFAATGARAATIGEAPADLPAIRLTGTTAVQLDSKLVLPTLGPTVIPAAQMSSIAPARPEDFAGRVQQLSVSIDKAGAQTQAPGAADGGSAAAGRQFDLLADQTPAADEPSAEDLAAAKRQLILRNPEVPPGV